MIYDLIVIGAGSGGLGAAITAGRRGLRTLWIEKEAQIGGTATLAGVSVWQPAYCTSRLAREIWERLHDQGKAHLVEPNYDFPRRDLPIYLKSPKATYEDTLKRMRDRKRRTIRAGIVFDRESYVRLIEEMASESGNVELTKNCVFRQTLLSCGGSGGERHIDAIVVDGREGEQTLKAKYFIDATADIEVAVLSGCATALGEGARDLYEEPSAPEKPQLKLNGWTLMFNVAPGPGLDGPAEDPTEDHWSAHICEQTDGSFDVNPCLMLVGEEGYKLGHKRASEILLHRVFAWWPKIREAYNLDGYGIRQIAPHIGVRETRRLVGRYVLTEHDFRQGDYGEHHPDCVAFCDHALDTHAPGGGCTEVPNGPFGVPFRCLQPREVDNLLVACRGASFSHIAASAARLQRTMIELGEAAANYLADGRAVPPQRPPYRV